MGVSRGSRRQRLDRGGKGTSQAEPERIPEAKQEESEEPEKEQSVTVEEVMRQYLETFCHGRSCMSCPLNAPNFTCGRGYHFITNPVSDEEVRRAYTTVLQKMKEN